MCTTNFHKISKRRWKEGGREPLGQEGSVYVTFIYMIQGFKQAATVEKNRT